MQKYENTPITADQVVPIAEEKKALGIPLTMIHGYPDKEGKNVISYDYAQGETVYGYTVTGESTLPSISPIYHEAAAWAERELNELMPVTFTGLDTSARLFLPEDMLDEKGQILVETLDELAKRRK